MKNYLSVGFAVAVFTMLHQLITFACEYRWGKSIVTKHLLKALSGFLLIISVLTANVGYAAEVPGFDKPVRLQAVEQTVPAFIQSLFSQIGVPVRVESGIPGTVNGAFQGTAEEVFAQISQAFNVFLYYDTYVAYVYPSDEMQSVILSLTHSAAKRVSASAIEMGLVDSRNYVTPIAGGGLMVNGSVRFTEQIESLSRASREQVKSVKPKKSPVELRLFKLKFAWADDIQLPVGGRNITVPGVATLLRTLILDDGSLPLASGVSVRRDELQLSKLKGLGLSSGAPSDDAGEQAIRNPLARGVSTSQFSIVAQPQLNAVAIRDTADRMPLYEQLIESLDVEPEMVEIEATIIDIDVERTRELGINWRLQGSDAEALFGNGTVSDTRLQPGQIITPQGKGGVLSLVLGDSTQFFARVKALEAEGAANIVSKPHVLTLSNVEAILGATTEFFVRVEGNEEVDLFNVPVGTTLRVTPHVYSKGLNKGIKLLVNIEDGAVQTSSVDDIPLVERSTISTQALINEGSSLLIGGLVRESVSEKEVSVPGLGKVPFVGNLFRSKQSTKFKRERLFMITPRTAKSNQAFDIKGPTLQGDPMDILSSPDRLDAPEIAAITRKKESLVADLRDESPVQEPVRERKELHKRFDQEMTLALLDIPNVPTSDQLAQAKVVDQWNELNDRDSAKEIVAFKEVSTEVQETEIGNERISYVESPAAFTVAEATIEESNHIDPEVEIKTLARNIARDLKARRSDSALEKITLMKKLDPAHDYAVNGESYVALMIGYK